MQKLHKKPHSILTNLTLKKEIAQELAKELNVNESRIDLSSDSFIKYAIVLLELKLYGGIIPYDDLEYYRLLLKQKEQFKIEIKEKI